MDCHKHTYIHRNKHYYIYIYEQIKTKHIYRRVCVCVCVRLGGYIVVNILRSDIISVLQAMYFNEEGFASVPVMNERLKVRHILMKCFTGEA